MNDFKYNEHENYLTREAKNNCGTFFYTDCGNRMYSINNEYIYDNCFCPKCGKVLHYKDMYKELEKILND